MKKTSLLGLLGTLAICTPLLAQQPPDNGGGGGGGWGGGGPGPDQQQDQPDRGRMGRPPGGGLNQMLDRLKDDLAADDQQWTSMSPRIKTILQIEHELYAGPGPGGPPGGPQGGGPQGGGPQGDRDGGARGDGGPQGNDQGGQNGRVNADAMGGGNGAPPPPDGGPNGGGPNGGGPNAGGPNGGGPNADQDGPDHGSTTQPSAAMSAEADAVRHAKRALGQLIHDPDATNDEMKAALKTLQDVRAAAKTVLAQTQKELLPMVTDRQHAILVAFSILD